MNRVTATIVVPLLLLSNLGGCDSGPTGVPWEFVERCSSQTLLSAPDVGRTLEVSGSALELLCITAGTPGTSEYVLVLHAGSGAPTDTLRLDYGTAGLRAAGNEPGPLGSPSGAPGLSPLSIQGDDPEPAPALHSELRRIEEGELAPRIRPGAPPAPLPAAAEPAALPAVGSFLELNTRARSPACQDPVYRTGRVEAVSSAAIVVADTLNPSNGFTRSDYEHFAATFDTLVAPVTEDAFGTPSDIDGNGRVILFFTQEVNRLTTSDSDSFIGGFFFARDLFPTEETARFQACPHSNEGEVLYLLVPDPLGSFGGRRTVEFVDRRTLGTMAHELQHLINASRRLHVLGTSNPFEEIWLNEGLSHLAEELLFYQASGLSPGQNLDVPTLQQAGGRAIDAINRHQLSNAQRFRNYLRAPSTSSPYSDQDLLATRGAAWHFLRYVADRRGGDHRELFRELVDGPGTGLGNLASALGGSPVVQDWFEDWSVAVYADSRVPDLPDRYREQSWNHPSLFRTLDEQGGASNPPFPLAVTKISSAGTGTHPLAGGGTLYLRFALEQGTPGELQFSSDGGPPPEAVRGVLLRIR